jgi:hypothetical protein
MGEAQFPAAMQRIMGIGLLLFQSIELIISIDAIYLSAWN